ncbi:ABC transporter ATP-binding protein/permease [Bdellovibrio sp. HCB337]|uniref:ABC transporter ATP-binding protein/permease n=1 Tax=Bdellovibrio sp. HCB337 TaxID=3394358 RepID=UPI0039A64EBC
MNAHNTKSSTIRLVLREMVFPFWTKSEKKARAWFYLLLTFALIGASVYCLVLLNKWNQAFYDALQNLNRAEFFKQLWIFFAVAFSYVLVGVYKFFIIQRLMLDWREWLTEKNLQQWLSHKSYYFWQLSENANDNPDQRLSEDIRELTNLVLSSGEKIFREGITFVSFIGILWAISGSFTFENIFGYKVEFTHYLVWTCLVYAIVGTWIMHKVGRPLANLNFEQQKFEADFRYSLVRLRENSESVALSHGEPIEKKNLSSRFSKVIQNFKEIIEKQKQLLFVNNTYSQLAYIFPFVVASPKLFLKEISLGQLFQISSAFGQVQGSVSVFITLYSDLARLKSVVDRLGGFFEYMQNAKGTQAQATKNITFTKNAEIEISQLTLKTPDEKLLLKNLSQQIPLGTRLLIKAPSGYGKSTLIRTLQSMWPYHEGQISIPENMRMLTIPQKPYLLVDTLKASLTYPLPAESFSDEQVSKLLDTCKLSHLKLSLHVEDNWDQKLSPGEQQRVSFIRVLLQKPDVVFLDEATSAVDEETQHHLYKLLIENHPQMTIVSVAHHESLKEFHSQVLDLTKSSF